MGTPGRLPGAVAVLVRGEEELVLGRVSPPFDLGQLDGLARLQLAVRQQGWRLLLREPCPTFRGLLDLTGLLDVLVESGREPERGEQLGVDEVVQPRDPSF